MNSYITIRDLSDAKQHVADAMNPIVFVVEKGDVYFCGLVIDKTFGYRMGNQHANIGGMIHDFIVYESGQNRTPLVFVQESIDLPLPAPDKSARDGWVVHSTDAEAGESILKMGRLCSRNHLLAGGIAFRPFGREEIGEPADYSDLVNFARLGPGSEIIVASKQHEKFCSETDIYAPGMRFYFNTRSLMSLPNYVAFLGGHAVRGTIELDEVEHRVVSVSEMGRSAMWTPETFAQAADALFEKKISNQGGQAAR